MITRAGQPQDPAATARRVATIAVTGAAVAMTVWLGAVQVASNPSYMDLSAYYNAAIRLRAGLTPYDPLYPHGLPTLPYIYPPQTAALLAAISWPDEVFFQRCWIVLTLAAYWAFAFALARLASWRMMGTAALVVILIFAPGVLVALGLGQADVLVWAGLSLALAFPAVCGAGLAMAAVLKVYGCWALLAAALRGDWRVVRQGAAVLIIATVLAALVIGPATLLRESWIWAADILPRVAQGQYTGGSFGKASGLLKYLPRNLSIPAALGFTGAAAFAISMIAPVSVAWLGRGWKDRELHYISAIAAAVLFSPLARPAYAVALLPIVPLAVRAWRRRGTWAAVAVPGRAETPA